jgi:hypothetical protein
MAPLSPGFRPADLRPMDLGEILDHTFRVYKRAWKPLLILGIIRAIPTVIQGGYMGAMSQRSLTDSATSTLFFRAIFGAQAGNYGDLAELGLLALGLLLLTFLLYPLFSGAIIAVASRAALGLETTVGGALRIGLKRYWAMLGTLALQGLFLFLGAIGAIIGGLLFLSFLTVPVAIALLSTYMTFTRHAVIVEQSRGGMPAIRRSFGLVNGRFWPLLGIGIVAVLFLYVLAGQLSFVTVTPIQLVQMFYLKYHASVALAWVAALLSGLISAITGPLLTIVLTLVYYDTRMRKEGFDMELLAADQPVEG